MTIIYRALKGAPLTIEEIDGSFKDLDTRLEVIEEHTLDEGGISEILLDGDELVIQGTHHNTLGRVRLPMPQFSGRGAWETQQHYNVYDLVRHEITSYLCLKPHQSDSFEQERDYWQVLWQSPQTENNSSRLPLFIKSNLPSPEPGAIGLLIDDEKVLPVYADGKAWRQFSDHETIGE